MESTFLLTFFNSLLNILFITLLSINLVSCTKKKKDTVDMDAESSNDRPHGGADITFIPPHITSFQPRSVLKPRQKCKIHYFQSFSECTSTTMNEGSGNVAFDTTQPITDSLSEMEECTCNAPAKHVRFEFSTTSSYSIC